MAEPSAFDRENSKLQPLGPPPGLLDQFNLPPAFVAFVRRNRRPLSMVAAVGLALALGISGYTTYRDHRAGKAAAALDAALAAGAGGRGQLEQVASGFAATPSAVWARIELARLDEREGQRAAAIAKYEAVNSTLGSGSLVKPLVLIKLAGLLEQDKQWDRALALYNELAAIEGFAAEASRARGRVNEQAGRKAEAAAAYATFLELTAPADGQAKADPERDMIRFKLNQLKK
jgi:predicted negative regulator of RcsB-dependent stress response